MKKIILSIVLLTACSLNFSATGLPQDDGNSLSVTDTEVLRTGTGTVSVAFQLQVGNSVTARNRSLIIRPVLSGDGGESELPPIIIRGDKAKFTAESNAMSAAGISSYGRYVTGAGSLLDYFAEVPWQEWMRGSRLVFNGINAGKSDATEVSIGVVAEDLLQGQAESMYAHEALPIADLHRQEWSQSTPAAEPQSPTYASTPAPAPLPATPVSTVGDELAARFTFVEPDARYIAAKEAANAEVVFDYNMPLILGDTAPAAKKEDDVSRFVEMTRHGAVRIEFARGSKVVDRSLGENNKMLVDLISSIKVIDGTPSLRVSQVVVVGFSAPEGADEKETLAKERAESTLKFITDNSKVDPTVINVYNGSVDWVSLRALVAESNMPDKYKVLEIMDNIPEWGSTQGKDRMTWLMELGDGVAFKYIRENFFPKLRQMGAYVKVYYESLR